MFGDEDTELWCGHKQTVDFHHSKRRCVVKEETGISVEAVDKGRLGDIVWCDMKNFTPEPEGFHRVNSLGLTRAWRTNEDCVEVWIAWAKANI